MSPQAWTRRVRRELPLEIQNLIDGHPNHRTIASIMRCREGCARHLVEHMAAIDRAEETGRIPRVPRGPGV